MLRNLCSGTAFLVVSSLIFLMGCNSKVKEKPLQPQHSSITHSEKNSKDSDKKVENSPKKDSKKYLYLTFDDGPNKGTSQVVKSLQKEKIPATLFLVGEHIYGSKAQLADFEFILKDTLFQIANHSYSHANNQFSKYYKDSSQVLADFQRINDSLNRKLMISRTPGRNIWRLDSIKVTDLKSSKDCADYLAENGFVLVGWDIEWKCTNESKLKETSDEMMSLIDSAYSKKQMQTENHLVLLTHDQYFRDSLSIAELDKFLQKLKNREDIVIRKIKDYPGIGTEVQ